MLKLMNLDDVTKNLVPITSTEFFVGKTTTFHPDGLFSEKIFGPADSPDRRNNYSYIELNTKVLHPALFPVLRRLEQKLFVAMSGEKKYTIDAQGTLVADDKGEISNMSSIIKNFNRIKFRGGTAKRDDLIQLVEGYKKDNQVFIDKMLVIPPPYRDITIQDNGEVTIQPMNDYYMNILRLSLQLTSMSSGTVYELLSYRMFNLVKDMYDYIISKLAKKSGLLRGHMLGKRVDFSARAVITGSAAELKPNELGVPFKLLVKLFEPFILHELLVSSASPKEILSKELEAFNGSKLSALSLRKLFIGIYKHDDIPENLERLISDAIDRAIVGKVVIAKRDPALHAESVQAFYPKLIQGNTIKLSPVKCSAYNADFDGDQMALYVPITKQAIEEAKDKLMISISKDGTGQIADDYNKDVVIGSYMLTKDAPKNAGPVIKIKSPDEAYDHHIYQPVDFGGIKTTAGRVIFNQVLPKQMKFVNIPIDKKAVNKLANHIHNKYGIKEYNEFSDKLLKVTFKYGTLASPSFSANDFKIPADVRKLKEKLADLPPEQVTDVLNHAEKRLAEEFTAKGTNLGVIGAAGGLKGGWNQTRQILVAKGLIQDNEGNVMDPITDSYADGFNSKEFFQTGSGTRKGISDRVLNTAQTGYLSRQLVYALQRVEADPSNYNCGTKKFFRVKVTKNIASKLKGRYLLVNGKPKEIADPEQYIGKVIPLKSPLYCTSTKICSTCYGKLLERNRTLFVGVVAAQIIGERGTQLIMKCSSGLVHYKNQLWAFEDLWKEIDSDVTIVDGKETKVLSDVYVSGKDSEVETLKIQKHDPTDDLLFISTKEGHNIIVQANHPLWIKKTNLHPKYPNEKCRLIGDNVYKEYAGTRKEFVVDNDELIEVQARDVDKHDAIWIDTTIALNENSVIPNKSGYICGAYCGDGFKQGKDRITKGNGISQTKQCDVRDKILKEAKINYERVSNNRDYISMYDNDQEISTIVLGNYAWEKRLATNYIDYDKQWLRDFISGLIDTDGTVFTISSTVCRISTTSHYLAQQLKSICVKLGYKCNTNVSKIDRPGKNSIEGKRPAFSIDISFIENPNLDSVKLNSLDEIKFVKQRKEMAIKGFDVISSIKVLSKWNYPVYDIQTETSEFMMNMVQNHNTFHSGGAVSVNKIDVKNILSDYMSETELKRFLSQFKQVENDVISSVDGTLTINKSEYLNPKKDIVKTKDGLNLAYGYFEIVTRTGTRFSMTIDANTIVSLAGKTIQESETQMVITFKAASKVFTVPPVTDSFSDKMKQVEHLLSGKKPWRSADHFCMKVFDQYAKDTDADFVHFEILASNLLRDARNPSYPARLSKDYQAVIVNIKQIPALESWLSALSFENPNEAITMGLTYHRDQSETVLEKIVNGNL